VFEEGRPADVLLNRFLRTHRELGSRDRRFLSQAVFSFFRWHGWTVGKLRLPLSEACLIGVALDTTELPPSFRYMLDQFNLPAGILPIGDQSVEDKRDALIEWFKDVPTTQPPVLNDLFPADFEDVVDPASIERCVVSFQQRPPAWIRSRAGAEPFLHILDEQHIQGRVHPHIPTALSLEAGTNLSSVLKKHSGQFVVQDISSQCVGLVCNPARGEDWWDCCAGAGGKALHLMDLMQLDGKVLATDVRNEALKELKKRARHHGIRNIRTQPFNAVNDEPFRKTFDGVLADAPCSGWGTWARNPDARWRTSRKEVTQCANRQLKILSNATWCVKPGGVMVYAVCTFTRPETDEVVMNVLDHHPNFKLAPFTHPLTGEPTDGHIQIWPWEGPGDAMFIARFIRAED
ncbi:MAG TPA: class I SAM-dependent methyltransferase, partial [Pontiella sp.]|nr:class I SAM-dependent methyltransferase [Pontiella sp.]